MATSPVGWTRAAEGHARVHVLTPARRAAGGHRRSLRRHSGTGDQGLEQDLDPVSGAGSSLRLPLGSSLPPGAPHAAIAPVVSQICEQDHNYLRQGASSLSTDV